MDFKTKPLPPVDPRFRGNKLDRDHAKNGYSLRALEALVDECNNQPSLWRVRADKAHAYYDIGKQMTREMEHKIRALWGIEPVQINLIHGVINGVLGQEARMRTDVVLEADDDDFQDVADVLSKQHKEASRESNVDMAVSNAYAGQVKGGIGWVEVSRAIDPLDYPVRAQEVDRREIYFDWEAKNLGLSDARWLIRKRWYDLDEACAWMPEHEAVLRQAINGWDLTLLPDTMAHALRQSFNAERETTIDRDEWADSARQRIKLFEVWYRVPASVVVLHTGPGRRIQYDENNPLHVMALQRGIVKASRTNTMQVRMAIFAGPHRLLDVGTNRRAFPYVPFFAFREDGDRSPYGLIEGMIAPQDEYGTRRNMINWLLQARQIRADSDALDPEYNNIKDLAREAMRPDFMAVMNPNRRNANALTIESNLQLQQEQLQAMQDAKQLIQEVPRVYSTQLGDAPSGVTSGIAIQSLTEAGATAMGELNDNYRYGRRLVHERILDLNIEDLSQRDLRVVLGSGQSKRVIVLNSWGPKGEPINHVKDAPIKVGLSDVPTSPAFRMQEQQQMSVIIGALQNNPAAINVLAPAFIEGSSLSNRKALADDLRRATGQPVAGDRSQQDAAQKAQGQAQALEMANKEAETKERQTKARVNESQAKLNMARAQQMGTESALRVREAMQPQPQPAANDEQTLIDDAIREARGGR